MFPAARARQATTTRSEIRRRIPRDGPVTTRSPRCSAARVRRTSVSVPATRPLPVLRGWSGQLGPGTRHGPADSRRSARLGDGWGASGGTGRGPAGRTLARRRDGPAVHQCRGRRLEPRRVGRGDTARVATTAIRSPRASCRRWARRCRPRCGSSVRCSGSCGKWVARCSVPRWDRPSVSFPAKWWARPISACR